MSFFIFSELDNKNPQRIKEVGSLERICDMFARELCVRLRENLIVEEKGNSWSQENRKEYVAGE